MIVGVEFDNVLIVSVFGIKNLRVFFFALGFLASFLPPFLLLFIWKGVSFPIYPFSFSVMDFPLSPSSRFFKF